MSSAGIYRLEHDLPVLRRGGWYVAYSVHVRHAPKMQSLLHGIDAQLL